MPLTSCVSEQNRIRFLLLDDPFRPPQERETFPFTGDDCIVACISKCSFHTPDRQDIFSFNWLRA